MKIKLSELLSITNTIEGVTYKHDNGEIKEIKGISNQIKNVDLSYDFSLILIKSRSHIDAYLKELSRLRKQYSTIVVFFEEEENGQKVQKALPEDKFKNLTKGKNVKEINRSRKWENREEYEKKVEKLNNKIIEIDLPKIDKNNFPPLRGLTNIFITLHPILKKGEKND